MRKLYVPHIITAASLALPLIGQQYTAGPVARTAPLAFPDPVVNTLVINTDGNAAVTAIDQCELRSLGGGLYRVAATVRLASATGVTRLITGTLNLAVAPPVWTPNQDVAAFNQGANGVDAYQLSVSQDGLTAVWDRYASATYPNSGGPAYTFCCRRAATTVPFAVNDVRAIAGVGAGGVDPHIGEELQNGNVVLYHMDFLVSYADIVKAELDPLTGTLGAPSIAAAFSGNYAGGFAHSPFVHRDSTGQARALNYCEQASGGHSNAIFREGVGNDGTPEMILNGSAAATPTLTDTWYNNPGLVGGSWHYATAGASQPQLQEVTMLAAASPNGSLIRIAAWSPARPLPGSGSFFSVVAVGLNVGLLSQVPFPVPPVLGNAYLQPALGILPFTAHDPYTGLAEWTFPTLLPSPGWNFDMQMFTLNTANGVIYAGNNARLSI